MPMFDEIKGFGVTFKRLFKKDLTIEYPDERRPLEERFRGLPVLRTDPETQEAICVGCSMCERICPTQCISMEFTPGVGDGERDVVVYTLDAGRCMYCGLCAKSCPVDAITMSNAFELSVTTREGLIYQKSQLAEIGATAREYFAQ
ncbi:MAG: NADH-quinone oxidoreductase subunit I [Thermomicrobia bacterium]|nr:NADH-quinone oxidoreductase subunit I [Thermomicrobia bacterium]MCA1723703.1 NADH-quinone oxidoreductase subunit I [Thermomicrobia bacterium]